MFRRVPINGQRALRWAIFSLAAGPGLTIAATALKIAMGHNWSFNAITHIAALLSLTVISAISMSLMALCSAAVLAHLTNKNDLRRLNLGLAILAPVGLAATGMLTIGGLTTTTAGHADCFHNPKLNRQPEHPRQKHSHERFNTTIRPANAEENVGYPDELAIRHRPPMNDDHITSTQSIIRRAHEAVICTFIDHIGQETHHGPPDPTVGRQRAVTPPTTLSWASRKRKTPSSSRPR